MKMIKVVILLAFFSCATDELTRQVIMEDTKGITNREEAVKFYFEKKILTKYNFTKDGDLLIFDCSGENWITDIDLKYIVFFPEIVSVHVSGKKVTDKFIYYLQNLENLSSIYFYDTSITGEGFFYLKNKTKLKSFNFQGSPISDSGLKYLSEIRYEKEIDTMILFNSKITDRGMKYIANMKFGKAFISLFNTKVTDEGIKYLAGFKELKEIDLRETKVTDKGGKWLREQLPNTEIYWGKFIREMPTGMDEEE